MEFLFEFFVIFAVLKILIIRKVLPELVRFELKAFKFFLLLMFCVSFLRILYVSVAGKSPVNIHLFDFYSLFFVFWEDMFFVFPSIFFYHLTKNRYLVAFLMLISSIIFAMGHLYQGTTASLILTSYVPIAFYFGRKYGLGTVMACHVTYDVLTYLTFHVINLL